MCLQRSDLQSFRRNKPKTLTSNQQIHIEIRKIVEQLSESKTFEENSFLQIFLLLIESGQHKVYVPLLLYTINHNLRKNRMERKRIIAIVIMAIVIVGFSGWYFLYGTQKPKPVVSADVTIDGNDYTMPIIWNLTAVSGATNKTSHTMINKGTSKTNMAFNTTIWHLVGNQWTEVWNGTNWFNGTSWVSASYATVQPSIISIENTTRGPWTAFAYKPPEESSTYYYNVTYNDQMIYFNLEYQGSNPTIDGQTVFAYVAFDGNGNGILDASDKAFNFTSNPSLPTENNLTIYTPASNSSWNTRPTATFSWNGSVLSNSSAHSNSVPITVVYSSNRTNITFAIPLNYIGAQIGGKLGFALQAFSHYWATANATTPANFTPVSLSFLPVTSFSVEPNIPVTFYTEALFTSAASGDYSIVFEFQATVQNSS
jgi:hypothetical protein